jgi:hypothetical protein
VRAACNRCVGVSVAIIGTSSGPGRAAICRERKPDSPAASNNFLEVADNLFGFCDSGKFHNARSIG